MSHRYQQRGRNETKRRRINLPCGSRGLLVTVNAPIHAHSAQKEIMRLLQLVSDEDATTGEVSADPAQDLDAALVAEVEELRKDSLRFVPIKEISKSVNFIRFTKEEDSPAEFAHRILTSARDGKDGFSCRFISRIIPIEASSKPHPAEFENMMRDLICHEMPGSAASLPQSATPEGTTAEKQAAKDTASPEAQEDLQRPPKAQEDLQRPKTTWAVQFNYRSNMKTIRKEDACDNIGNLVGTEAYKVDLSSGTVNVLVEINQLFAGASVVKEFHELQKYNLHRLCHKDEEGGKEAGRDSSEAENE